MMIGPCQPSPTGDPRHDYTAADALVVIDSWVDLTRSRRQALATALGLLKRALGRPLEAIKLSAEGVARALNATTAAACNLTEPTFKAYRSSLRYVLRRLGLLATRRPRSGRDTLRPAWTARLAQLTNRFLRLRMEALAGFCSGQGVDPDDVTDKTIAAFLEHQRTGDIKGIAFPPVGAWNARPGGISS